jgi:hypothetical protein
MIFAHLRNCANDQMLKPESQIQGFDPQIFRVQHMLITYVDV